MKDRNIEYRREEKNFKGRVRFGDVAKQWALTWHVCEPRRERQRKHTHT